MEYKIGRFTIHSLEYAKMLLDDHIWCSAQSAFYAGIPYMASEDAFANELKALIRKLEAEDPNQS